MFCIQLISTVKLKKLNFLQNENPVHSSFKGALCYIRKYLKAEELGKANIHRKQYSNCLLNS